MNICKQTDRAIAQFGGVLRGLRERRGLSLRELSALCGLDHAYIQRLEIGERTCPSKDTLVKILRPLKPTVADKMNLAEAYGRDAARRVGLLG